MEKVEEEWRDERGRVAVWFGAGDGVPWKAAVTTSAHGKTDKAACTAAHSERIERTTYRVSPEPLPVQVFMLENAKYQIFSNVCCLISPGSQFQIFHKCFLMFKHFKIIIGDRILVVPYSLSKFLLQRSVPVGRCRLLLGPQDGATSEPHTLLWQLYYSSQKINTLAPARPPTRLHAVGVQACSSLGK